MKKILYILTTVFFCLVACSEDQTEEASNRLPVTTDEEDIEDFEEDKSSSKDVENVNVSEDIGSDEKKQSQLEESSYETATSSIIKETSEENIMVIPDERIEVISKDDIVLDDIKEVGHYDYYTELNQKTSGAFLDEIQEDGVIELPLHSTNEEILKIEDTVVLQELFDRKIIRYIEEPLTEGYVIVFDTKLLQEYYFSKSYSVTFDNVEYPLSFYTEPEDLGIVFIGETDIDDEQLNKAILNIIN